MSFSLALYFSGVFKQLLIVFPGLQQQMATRSPVLFFVLLQKIRLLKSSVEVLTKEQQLPFSFLFSRTIFPASVDSLTLYPYSKCRSDLFLSVCVNILNTKFLSTCVCDLYFLFSLGLLLLVMFSSFFVLLSLMTFLPCLFLAKACSSLNAKACNSLN